eukprot:366571-Chlamydomonas_euryale.AAC.9
MALRRVLRLSWGATNFTNVTRLRRRCRPDALPPWQRHSVEVGLVIPLPRRAAGRSYQALRPGGEKTEYCERWSDTSCTPGLLL